MPTQLERIDDKLAAWLVQQPLFFVATAPRADDQFINVSPKGLDGCFTVLDDHTVAYLDLTGSGIETIAHLRENGRIVLMFCAFEGRPNIIRLHGRGEAVLPDDPRFPDLVSRFTPHPGVRSVIVVDVARTSESCGWGVPLMTHTAQRDVLDLSAVKKGDDGLVTYRAEHNARSIDGLPGYPL